MFAVESKFFDNGAVKVNVRLAKLGETSKCERKPNYDFYVDIFETEESAHGFAKEADYI